MDWNRCQNFGLIRTSPNQIDLYYDMFNFRSMPSPNGYFMVESAMWQGQNLIVRGTNQYGEFKVFIYYGFYDFQQIA